MGQFKPKALITTVLEETKDLFDYKPCFNPNLLPNMLLGDSDRLQYILACLLKYSVKRNKEQNFDVIQISAFLVTDNPIVDCDV